MFIAIWINVNEINYTKSKKIDSTVVMKGSYYKDKDLNLSEINFLEGANKIILNMTILKMQDHHLRIVQLISKVFNCFGV